MEPQTSRRTAQLGAWAVLLGTVLTTLGLAWDVQWHIEVGPDTFFTLSHLALYSGSAISGFASLAIVLRVTGAQRAGRPVHREVGGTPIQVFGGTFAAPLGYLISGVSSASFLLYGLLDLWWHTIYGFDAVLHSPPHVALFLSISLTMVGSVVIFAAASDHRWGRLGVLLAIPILIVFAPVTTNAFSTLPLPIDPTVAGIIFFSTMLLIVGAAVVRRPGAALAIAGVLAGMQAFLWWFAPWAAHTYAAAVGLPLRDGLSSQPPAVSSGVPMFLLLAAAFVEGVFWWARNRNLNVPSAFLLAGSGCGLIVGATLPLQQVLTDPTALFAAGTAVTLAVVGAVLGALAGLLATPFTVMLRTPTRVTAEVR
ncbi:MAG: hypothetical protein JWR37_4280 [Mycobacterium sp.]|jgi:hypothetical protein|nr:hypothetical protein [Mycobacterium sp.]